jgi:hypothetical protein
MARLGRWQAAAEETTEELVIVRLPELEPMGMELVVLDLEVVSVSVGLLSLDEMPLVLDPVAVILVVPDLEPVLDPVGELSLDELLPLLVFVPVLVLELVSSLVFDLLPDIEEVAALPETVPEVLVDPDFVPMEDLERGVLTVLPVLPGSELLVGLLVNFDADLLTVPLPVSVEDFAAPALLVVGLKAELLTVPF